MILQYIKQLLAELAKPKSQFNYDKNLMKLCDDIAHLIKNTDAILRLSYRDLYSFVAAFAEIVGRPQSKFLTTMIPLIGECAQRIATNAPKLSLSQRKKLIGAAAAALLSGFRKNKPFIVLLISRTMDSWVSATETSTMLKGDPDKMVVEIIALATWKHLRDVSATILAFIKSVVDFSQIRSKNSCDALLSISTVTRRVSFIHEQMSLNRGMCNIAVYLVESLSVSRNAAISSMAKRYVVAVQDRTVQRALATSVELCQRFPAIVGSWVNSSPLNLTEKPVVRVVSEATKAFRERRQSDQKRTPLGIVNRTDAAKCKEAEIAPATVSRPICTPAPHRAPRRRRPTGIRRTLSPFDAIVVKSSRKQLVEQQKLRKKRIKELLTSKGVIAANTVQLETGNAQDQLMAANFLRIQQQLASLVQTLARSPSEQQPAATLKHQERITPPSSEEENTQQENLRPVVYITPIRYARPSYHNSGETERSLLEHLDTSPLQSASLNSLSFFGE